MKQFFLTSFWILALITSSNAQPYKISNTGLTIIYSGIENNIALSSYNFSDTTLHIFCSDSNVIIKKIACNQFIIYPKLHWKSYDEAIFTIHSQKNSKTDTLTTLKIESIPPPEFRIHGDMDWRGVIFDSLEAKSKILSYFLLDPKIDSFMITSYRKDSLVFQVMNKGSVFNSNIQILLQQSQKNDKIIIRPIFYQFGNNKDLEDNQNPIIKTIR